MMDETKTTQQNQADEGPELVVQELFFEDYTTPDASADVAAPVVEPAERRGLVSRVTKGAMLGLLMLGSLVFAGLVVAIPRGLARYRHPSRLARLRHRFIH